MADEVVEGVEGAEVQRFTGFGIRGSGFRYKTSTSFEPFLSLGQLMLINTI